MYSSWFKSPGSTRMACLAVTAMMLSACADGATGPVATQAPAAPAPDYVTVGDHFAELQRAGLSGKYADFAKHLKSDDPTAVAAALQRSFKGGPFDVYTRKSEQTDETFQRLVELRSTSGRLYLYVAMNRVPGGWVVSNHDLDRKRAVIMARL